MKILSALRRFFAFSGERVFASPYLPDALVRAGLPVVFADLCVVLLQQPAAYWADHSRAANSLPPLQALLALHPLAFAAAGLVYMGIVWALTALLTRRLALVAWTTVAGAHLAHTLAWVLRTGLQSAGLTSPGELLTGSAWLLTVLTLGVLLSAFLLRPARAAAPAVAAPPTRKWKYAWAALAVVVVAAAAGAVLFVEASARSGWQPVSTAHNPGPRTMSALAYDTQHKTAVLFGGASAWVGSGWVLENDTWQWDGRDWTRLEPAESPMPRRGHAMAFDEKRGVTVLFGGEAEYVLGDTWEWDGQAWHEYYVQDGGPAPESRTDHRLFYDPQRGSVVLYGGYSYRAPNKQVVFYKDAWEWDGKKWSQIPQGTDAPYVSGYALAYDAVGQRLVAVTNGALLEWHDARWWPLTPPLDAEALIARQGARMAADPASHILLFGGLHDNVDLDETWLRSGSTWQELHPGLSPAARNAQVMFFDLQRGRFMLYGGGTAAGRVLADMWELALPPGATK